MMVFHYIFTNTQEVLQNAEDARATVVKFLYDENGKKCDPSLLYHPDLAKYQVVYQPSLAFCLVFMLKLTDRYQRWVNMLTVC